MIFGNWRPGGLAPARCSSATPTRCSLRGAARRARVLLLIAALLLVVAVLQFRRRASSSAR
jgi:hypothetical protein